MSGKKYAHLFAAFAHQDNLSIIVQALSDNFSDLFQLDVLEDIVQQADKHVYYQFFEACVGELADLYTTDEVVEKLLSSLANNTRIRDFFLKSTLFVPYRGEEKSPQLAFMEKFRSGSLRAAEPLTWIDMLRSVQWMSDKSDSTAFSVCHLKNVHFGKYSGRVIFVNLNQNLQKMPKWCVVDFRSFYNVRVYCETPLSESEKLALDLALKIKVKQDNYLGGKADYSVSTGYTALAWVNEEIVRTSALTLESDFAALVEEFIFTQAHLGNSEKKYFSDDYKLNQGGDYKLVRAIILGELEGHEYELNDLTRALQLIVRHHISQNQRQKQIDFNARSFVLGFDAALRDVRILTETADKVSLFVPDYIDIAQIQHAYNHHTGKYVINSSWMINIYRKDGSREGAAQAMVLATFRGRAKKPFLQLDLPPQYQLDEQEQRLILKLMDKNAYVGELQVNHNASLLSVQKELIPNLARNRWLQHNGYLPPMADDYWRRAARYWAIYLSEHSDALFPKKLHVVFHRCVAEMGLRGLEAILGCLNDFAERDFLDGIYKDSKSGFYAACDPGHLETYLNRLSAHIESGAYFPYTSLGVSLQNGFDEAYIRLFAKLNQCDRFEQIYIKDYLKAEPAITFLDQLIHEALSSQWVNLIVIPELDNKNVTGSGIQLIRSRYTLLNDIILRNRRLKESQGLVHHISTASSFEPGKVVAITQDDSGTFDDQPELLFREALEYYKDESWPLHRGGAIQLQLQQQQQIEQSRQLQIEQYKIQVSISEDILGTELVGWNNIERLLADYCKQLSEEAGIDLKYATLGTKDESDLQQFFHTWISANPAVEAKHAIKFMTQDAAKALLRKHYRLSSGLNPENLPKGFYSQRNKDGHLILCYKAELAYTNPPTPLTVNLAIETPLAIDWEGDFRQFSVDKYRSNKAKLSADDLPCLLLFALMQPHKPRQQEYDDFMRANPGLLGKTFKERVLANWLVFFQCWQYAGEKGVEFFLSLEDKDLQLNMADACKLLFGKQSPILQDWLAGLALHDNQVRALGQLYYRFGDVAVTLFLAKLQQMENQLGREFFSTFKTIFLNNIDNYAVFFSEAWFLSIDAMIEKLGGMQNEGKRLLWLSLCDKHMQAVNWEKIESLWQAFDYVTTELNDMGLVVSGKEFDALKPGNMLVHTDRILIALKRIPGQDEKQYFLRHLAEMDLNHGGVCYAITKENFRFFDPGLELHDFDRGVPTYAPDMGKLYFWNQDLELKIKRVLASSARFNQGDYRALCKAFAMPGEIAKDKLVWLLFTNYAASKTQDILAIIETFGDEFLSQIARHLHCAFYIHNNRQLAVDFAAMHALYTKNGDFSACLRAFPNGTWLEAVSILHAMRHESDFDQLQSLFACPVPNTLNNSAMFYEQGHKLVVLLGACNRDNLRNFLELCSRSRPVVCHEMRLLMTQLLSIDYEQSDLNALSQAAHWEALLNCITNMQADPSNTTRYRIAYIEALNNAGLRFQYSKSGDFRALKSPDEDGPADLNFFVDHEDRLWRFLQKHIAVPADPSLTAQDSLQYLMRFFKRLQLNRTYLNEIEPLLSSLENVAEGVYWTADYFYQLLRALQPKNDKRAFPIALLKTILQEPAIIGMPLDGLERQFPVQLSQMLQTVLQNTNFDRLAQAKLCKLVLREFNWQGSTPVSQDILRILSQEIHQSSQNHALDILLESSDPAQFFKRFERVVWFLQQTFSNPVLIKNWPETSACWLKALGARDREEQLMIHVQTLLNLEPEKQAMVFHIVAFSTLQQRLKSHDAYMEQLDRKALKLVKALALLPEAELLELANYYPKQPSPDARDILYFIKQRKTGVAWSDVLDSWGRKPNGDVRREHASLLATREVDLQRMITDTRVSVNGNRKALTVEQATRLTLSFTCLKQLESGISYVDGANRSVFQMSQEEIAASFKHVAQLVKNNPRNDECKMQLWALLFEALGRTTLKYPHLAQQFSIIANDMCIDSKSRALQLATGEGKSHFVALRAAYYAAIGKTVEVCTAKNSLAERDCEDYRDLFVYLGMKANIITPKSGKEEYLDADIHYTTLGGFSLFLDESSYNMKPVEVHAKDRVILFDEFDFIFFEEGLNTGYNYARPTGRTPKQMNWFYEALNDFYVQNRDFLAQQEFKIRPADLERLVACLFKAAADYDERSDFVKELMRDPLQLVQWLQSAHEANHLESGREFTVREENITVGDETYPMREIIPLSSDNQKMLGSSFSAGVHQLLAVRLNIEAKTREEAQNFHVHAESNIISSQVASERTRQLAEIWEGFSGTISSTQAQSLYHEHGTEVLHVPTNQTDLRNWHSPSFYQSYDARMDATVAQIRDCFNKKKSILFSCKNDRQVAQLKQKLQDWLTPEEYEHFIFYTNEEHRTASEVLQDKKSREAWFGGKKQYPVCLVASGFGRGDNVDVEAVILFNANDKNDLFQKGGRTARNGEEGDVFQFYLTDEILAEQIELQKELDTLLKQEPVDVVASMRCDNAQEEYERRFDNLLQLREIVFSIHNQENVGYHQVLANYSSWIMQFLSQLKDPTERNRLTVAVTRDLQGIEKEWLQISSKHGLSSNEKLKAIDTIFNENAIAFMRGYGVFSMVDTVFRADTRKSWIKLAVETEQDNIIQEPLLPKLGLVLMRLMDFPLNQQVMAKITSQILVLVEDESWLGEFINKAEKAATPNEILDALELVYQQKTKATPELLEYRELILKPEKILRRLDVGTEGIFVELYNELLPDRQQMILRHLSNPQILLPEENRVRAILPVLQFLGEFKGEEQTAWLDDYYQNIDQLSFASSPGLVEALNHLKPLHYRHFTALWQLSWQYKFPVERLQRAIGSSSEHRLRMLAICESWIRDLPIGQQSKFIGYFCEIMEQFEEGKNWDIFQRLVTLTNDKWSKNHGEFRKNIIACWKRVSLCDVDLSSLAPYMDWCLKQPGKNAFNLLSSGFAIPSARLLQHHQHIMDVWNQSVHHAANAPGLLGKVANGKSSARLALINQMLNSLASREQAISSSYILQVFKFTADVDMIDNLLSYPVTVEADLSPDELTHQIDFANKHILNFIKLFDWAKYVTAAELNQWLAGLTNISSILVARGHSSVPDNIDSLLSDFAAYLARSGVDKNTLSFKLKHYWHLVSDVIHEVANPEEIDVANLLHFQKKGPYDSTRRVIFMQLLNQGLLIDTQKGTDAVWTNDWNDKLLNQSLQQYVNQAKSILDTNKTTLTVRQEQALFQLSEELGMIAESGSKTIGQLHSLDSQNNKLSMACGLASILFTYQERWFKSTERQEHADSLNIKLEGLFASDVHEEGGYQRVLMAIHEAKIAAMKSDRAFNANRYFKNNQRGSSRYFDALNQMHDLVVTHWIRDKHAIQEFFEYRSYAKLEFLDVTKQLQLALDDCISESWLDEADPRRQDVIQKIFGFFDNGREQKFRQLSGMLRRFNAKSMDALAGSSQIRTLLELIARELSSLPGNLATIARDVLLLGKGLQGHLEELEKISFQPR